MAEKTRYSDEELLEFKELILKKLDLAQTDYNQLIKTLMNRDGNSVEDTSPTYKVMEDGLTTQSKEEVSALAARQLKYIKNLQAALARIENKTYGICRATGTTARRTSCHTEHRAETPKKSECLKQRTY